MRRDINRIPPRTMRTLRTYNMKDITPTRRNLTIEWEKRIASSQDTGTQQGKYVAAERKVLGSILPDLLDFCSTFCFAARLTAALDFSNQKRRPEPIAEIRPGSRIQSRGVNLLAIVILSRGKCGLSTCTTRYLVAMATADLLVIVTGVITRRIRYYYFPVSFLNITPMCCIHAVLFWAAVDCSVWFTITFTFDRFVAICCQKLKTKYCTEKTAAVVLATTCILLCLKNVPHYFKYAPREIIDNVPWFCVTKRSYYTEPGWVGFRKFNPVLTPLLPFALILMLNALTVRHILVASRVRKGLRGQSKGENRIDPEMESRRKSVILLFTISGNFILLWFGYVLYYLNITQHFDSDSSYIFALVEWMLQNLSCCTNTFIYGVTQSKFREQVKSAVKYPEQIDEIFLPNYHPPHQVPKVEEHGAVVKSNLRSSPLNYFNRGYMSEHKDRRSQTRNSSGKGRRIRLDFQDQHEDGLCSGMSGWQLSSKSEGCGAPDGKSGSDALQPSAEGLHCCQGCCPHPAVLSKGPSPIIHPIPVIKIRMLKDYNAPFPPEVMLNLSETQDVSDIVGDI
ncbi:uncharacterized protein [Heterodontus francisci]|uniref:uncharacterized protein n=1 Tax=Heterodontus francisci TaxID=7792 RepID=UPI00355B5899